LRVVPPPPSVQNAGNSARAGQLSSLSGAAPNVVPPAPSVAGNAAGARLDSMDGAGSQVVPPPPSIQNEGNSARAGRLSSLSSTRPNVVAPPPLVQGAGNAAGARLDATAGAGSQIVPPPPSVEGTGKAGASGRLSSLSGDGSIVPRPPTTAGTGNPGANGPGKTLEPMDPLPADDASATSAAGGEDKSTIEELPLGVLGVVFVAPGTSFFSNFEVFVAKRRVGKQLQLIKLVYEFLPYQRRLSEYNLNNLPPRVIKLRVTPDPSCDESLGHMILSETDPSRTAAEYAKLPEALRASDLTAALPCYRTTAGDFLKAMSRGR